MVTLCAAPGPGSVCWGMRFLLAILLLATAAWAEEVPSHDFFRITQTASRSTSTPGAWRYLIAPRTKEARRYWGETTGFWVRSLKIGIPVKLGPLVVEAGEGALFLKPGCPRFRPSCYTHPPLPQGLEAWKLELILVDFHNAFVWTLAEAKKHAKPYPATVTLSKFARIHVDPEGAFLVEPLGWKP